MEQEKLSWTVQAGFARQMRALAPIAKGVLTACALALIVLTPFGLMENTMGGKLFPLWFSALLLALSWGVLAVGGAIACLRRGNVESEYSLDAHTIRLTERGRQSEVGRTTSERRKPIKAHRRRHEIKVRP